MKAFLLFSGYNFYPSGGWADFVGTFDTVEDALCYFGGMTDSNDWRQVVDAATLKIVEEGER